MITLRYCRGSHPQLCRNIFRLKSIYEYHLHDDRRTTVATEKAVACLLHHLVDLALVVVIGDIKREIRLPYPLVHRTDFKFRLIRLQTIKQHKAKTIDHPCLQLHRRIAVVELAEVMAVEREVILMSNAVEVETGLAVEPIPIIIYSIGYAAVFIEILPCDSVVLAFQTIHNLLVRQCINVLFRHLHLLFFGI